MTQQTIFDDGPSVPSASATESPWQRRYSTRHRLERLVDFPAGLQPPGHVRIYRRQDHFVLQWWDRTNKRTASQRVDGDLLNALVQAREIDRQIADLGRAPSRPSQRTHQDLIAAYLDDLRQRTDAGEIDEATRRRYASALKSYQDFVEQPEIIKAYRHIGLVDRNFQLEFASYLARQSNSRTRRPQVTGNPYALATVGALYEWAKDAERGNLLPQEFKNPFVGRRVRSQRVEPGIVEELAVSSAMAVELVRAADAWQLRLVAPLVLFGLRPGELSWLFREDLADGWLNVGCIPELDYYTKGRREKKFPIDEQLAKFLTDDRVGGTGLLLRRRASEATMRSPVPKAELIQGFQRRCVGERRLGAGRRRELRDDVLRGAGQIQYDDVEGEFRRLAAQLKWPRATTLKDLRHHFSTSLENAGVPIFFRRYFMGHAPGRSPISTYTHLTVDKVREHYQRCLATELAPIAAAVRDRIAGLTG